ncbi:MAG TPA: sulfotransferase [Steroidobacteraceae bacterium]|nr:sulfotransferase [Steroidobacteraceae bacterium]
MAQYDGKIFGIGFYKTGTTTLFEALRMLGYDAVNGDTPGSYPGADDGATLIRRIDAGDYRLPTFEMFDAFTDNPYFRIWREIYAMFPDARYILTVRDEGPWIASCTRFFHNRRVRPMRLWMFGPHADPSRNEESRQAWLDAYRQHNRAVREFFATRPHQFLELDPTAGPAWESLCAFLGAPVPSLAWPHANPSRRNLPWRGLWRRLRRALKLEADLPPDDASGDSA